MEKQEDLERCESVHIHQDLVAQVNAGMPDEEILYDLAELFKLFASELCVCDIAQLLNMSQSAISHQLRALKQAKLVRYRREGKQVFYSLADGHVRTILGQGMEHVAE